MQIFTRIGWFQRGGRVRRQVAGQVRVGRRLRLLHRRGAQGGLPRLVQRLLTERSLCPAAKSFGPNVKHANKDETFCMMKRMRGFSFTL